MKKKIAIAADGDVISQHFGHCEGFFIFDIADGNVAQRSFLANPGHKPGLLPRLLHEARVQVVIAGGMGQGAIDLFNEAQIDETTGERRVIDILLAGTQATRRRKVLQWILGNRGVEIVGAVHEHRGDAGLRKGPQGVRQDKEWRE